MLAAANPSSPARSSVVLAYEAWQLHGPLLTHAESEFDPVIERRLRAGSSISANEYTAVLTQRARDQPVQHRWLESFDALMLPTTPITAPNVDAFDEQSTILSRPRENRLAHSIFRSECDAAASARRLMPMRQIGQALRR